MELHTHYLFNSIPEFLLNSILACITPEKYGSPFMILKDIVQQQDYSPVNYAFKQTETK